MKLLRNDLVKIIEGLMKENITTTEVEKSPVKESPNDAFAILFSEVEDALYDRREGITAELLDKGYRIIIGDDSRASAVELEKHTKSQIGEADLIVNLIGKVPGRKIKDDPNSRHIHKQIEFGLKSKKPSLIWLSSEVQIDKIENDLHRDFVKRCEDHTISEKDFDFVQGNEGNLTKLIHDHIEQIKQIRQNDSLKNSQEDLGEDLRVLLETHVDDYQHGFKLKKVLDKGNIDLIFNPEDGDPEETINSLYRNIGRAKKFIFLYGSGENKDWVNVRIKKTLQKLTEFDRYDQSIYVYMAPPHKQPEEFKLGMHPLIKVLDYSDKSELDEGIVSNLLENIKGNKS